MAFATREVSSPVRRRSPREKVAAAITQAGTDYLLAVKANQPGLMGEIEHF
ncbi:hypothetical protein ACWGS9_28610 [Bradyrhizobium sp. Arg314]